MPPPWTREPAGSWHELEVESAVLRGNPLGDPHVRPLRVYTPPAYDSGNSRVPAVFVLQGFTGQVDMWDNRVAFRPTFPELVDELFSGPSSPPPCVVALVDCWTSLGGSQFLDSPATGDYHTYLCSEVVPFVDAHFRTLAAPRHRGIMGKSSGGYGAMVTPMLRPDLFGGLATHAGDGLFELCYLREFGSVVRALRDHYDGSYEKFWDSFRSRPAFSRPGDHDLVNEYAMAACYSADPDGTVRFPFELETGRLVPEVWERWLRHDPVRMAVEPGHAEALRGLRAIWIDAGTRDEWYLDLAAQAFHRGVQEAGVPAEAVRFELFDAGHGQVEYRYPLALRFLAERLAA